MRLFHRRARELARGIYTASKEYGGQECVRNFARIPRRPHLTAWKDWREEAYKAAGALSGIGSICTVFYAASTYKSNLEKQDREWALQREERLTCLGRELSNNIGDRKEKLYKHFLFVKRSNEITLDYLDEIILDYDSILRYIRAFDSSVVPDQLKKEVYFQKQRFRILHEDFIKDYKSDKLKTIKQIRQCIFDMFNVVNVASRIAIMKTSPDHLKIWEKQLLLGLESDHISVDEARRIIAKHSVDELNDTYNRKAMFWNKESKLPPSEMASVKDVSIKNGTDFDFKSLTR